VIFWTTAYRERIIFYAILIMSIRHVGGLWPHRTSNWNNLGVVGKPHHFSLVDIGPPDSFQIFGRMGSGSDKTQNGGRPTDNLLAFLVWQGILIDTHPYLLNR